MCWDEGRRELGRTMVRGGKGRKYFNKWESVSRVGRLNLEGEEKRVREERESVSRGMPADIVEGEEEKGAGIMQRIENVRWRDG